MSVSFAASGLRSQEGRGGATGGERTGRVRRGQDGPGEEGGITSGRKRNSWEARSTPVHPPCFLCERNGRMDAREKIVRTEGHEMNEEMEGIERQIFQTKQQMMENLDQMANNYTW